MYGLLHCDCDIPTIKSKQLGSVQLSELNVTILGSQNILTSIKHIGGYLTCKRMV